MKKLLLIIALLPLSACVSQWDLQGHDPKEYYAKHPKVNKVESRNFTYLLHFQPGATRLDADGRDRLQAALRDVSPEATDTILVQTSASTPTRRESLRKTLRSLGYVHGHIRFETASDVAYNDARLIFTYAVVVLPDCPDWRLSPVTTYSNTSQGNFGCATTVNLGLQVADPRDLVRGKEWGGPDASRNSLIMQDYRAGKEIGKPITTGGAQNAEPAMPAPGSN